MDSTGPGREETLAALKEYIEHTRRVLDLSSLQITDVASAEDYRLTLQRAFTEIGALSGRNNEILDTYFYPLLHDDAPASEEEVLIMRGFTELLTDTTEMVHQDQVLIQLQAESMVDAADTRNDLREKVLARDNLVVSSYLMFNMLRRLYPDIDQCYRFRDVGIAAGKRLLAYLEPEKFLSLPDDECRELVLINSRYLRCLFEWGDQEESQTFCEQDLAMMRRSLALAEDPFYLERMPDYRWKAHVFRALQYLADFPENHNHAGFSAKQLEEIYTYTCRLHEYLKEYPEFLEGCPQLEQDFYLARNGFLTGRSTLEAYRKQLVELLSQRDIHDYSTRGMLVNFIIPYEFILMLDRGAVTETELSAVRSIYADIAGYAYHMPKTGVLSFMLSYLSDFLHNYVEHPGGIDFKSMCMKLMVSMHPPTYVHTLNVANLSRAMTARLIRTKPEVLVGILDTENTEEVCAREEDILDFAYQAALLHDIGKLFVVETIITYGRRLLDEEFSIIKAHTLVGASLLSQYPSTKAYSEIALGHHKWYDDSAGYPVRFKMADSKNKALIAVIAAADCLDAATDSVGRSYKAGKTLDDYIREVREGSGTRYAPFLVPLFEDAVFRTELEHILNEGRRENYHKAYHVLKEL